MLETFTHATEEALAQVAEEKKIRKTDEVFLLFALGSQFDHLIKQQVEKLGVFCLVADPSEVTAADVRALAPKGIILSGGPASVHAEPPPFDGAIFDIGIPVLGVCLGFQVWAKHVGLRVVSAPHREFGTHVATIVNDTPLFAGCGKTMRVLESHGDRIEPGDKLKITASTDNAPVAAGDYKNLYGVQFHPEVTETEQGARIYENFCFGICGAKDRYPARDVAQEKIAALREQVRGKRVLLALSGGSDSSVVAYLLKEAFADSASGSSGAASKNIRGIYIKGIDRPDDEANVHMFFGGKEWIDVKVVDATDAFLEALAGKLTMRDKRLAMRGVYKKILEDEAREFNADFIAQGTLYTDISESGGGHATGARKAVIKIHHNTGLEFSLPELMPLEDCVKDGARNIGRSIGVPETIITRHPFPGPGLLVRIEGEVTAAKLKDARAIDGIYIEEIRKWNLYDTVWQAGAVITKSEATFTKGDDAGTGNVVALWAVWSVNGFTARFAKLPYDFLRHVSQRITNEVREVAAVVYRVSDKPPATIEWG